MWGYIGITTFLTLIILFLGNMLDIILKEEVAYFKIISLIKIQSIFMFYTRRNNMMNNVAFYFEVFGYIFFGVMMLANIYFGLTRLVNNYYFTLKLNYFYVYLFQSVLVYFIFNIVVYFIGKNKKKRTKF
jgi:hypothetical protein